MILLSCSCICFVSQILIPCAVGWRLVCDCGISWPQGYKTAVHSQTQNKTQRLAACGHVSASSQSLRFILSLRRLYSSFIILRPGHTHVLFFYALSGKDIFEIDIRSVTGNTELQHSSWSNIIINHLDKSA